MSGYIVKEPASELELTVEWRSGYLRRGEAVAEDYGWQVRPVTEDTRALRVVRQEICGTTSRAVFDAGVPGTIYLVTSRVVTTLDRVLERTILFRVLAQATDKGIPNGIE